MIRKKMFPPEVASEDAPGDALEDVLVVALEVASGDALGN